MNEETWRTIGFVVTVVVVFLGVLLLITARTQGWFQALVDMAVALVSVAAVLGLIVVAAWAWGVTIT